MKKQLTTLLCIILIMFISITTLVSYINIGQDDNHKHAQVKAQISKNFSAIEKKEIENNISFFEEELARLNTNVVSECNKQIVFYENLLLETKSIENRENIQRLVETLEKMKSSYLMRENYNQTINGGEFLLFSAVMTINSFFNAADYQLASELLIHAVDNKTINSTYKPVNGSRVLNSAVFNSLAHRSSTSKNEGEHIAFPNSGTVKEKDLYYAIHGIHNFTKATSSSRTVTIEDVYDYEQDDKKKYGSIAGIAVSTMAAAQEQGVITPYKLYITETVPQALAEQHYYNSYIKIDGKSHAVKCVCDYTITQNHSHSAGTFNNYHSVNICVCGDIQGGDPCSYTSRYEIIFFNDSVHNAYCACGGLKKQGHLFTLVIGNPKQMKCTWCSYITSSDKPIITPVENRILEV